MSDKILRVSNIDAMVNRIKTHVEEINHTNEEIKNLAGDKVNELINSGELKSQIITDKSINANEKIVDGTITKDLLDDNIKLELTEVEKLSSQLETKANKEETKNIQQQVNNLVLGAVGDGNNAEVVQARGRYDLLNSRLNNTELSLEESFKKAGIKLLTSLETTDGAIDFIDGKVLTNTEWFNSTINVEGYKTINIPVAKVTSSNAGVAFVDANGNYMSGYKNTSLSDGSRVTLDIPINATSLKFSCEKSIDYSYILLSENKISYSDIPKLGRKKIENISQLLGGYVDGTNGKLLVNPVSSVDGFHSDINVEGYKTINFPSIKTSGTAGVAFLDANGEYISGYIRKTGSNGLRVTLDIPANAVTFRYSYIKDACAESLSDPKFDYILLDSEIDPNALTKVPNIIENVDNLTSIIGAKIITNLDQNNGGYVDATTGGLLISPSSSVDGFYSFIDVEGYKTINFPSIKTSGIAGVAFMDADDNYISGYKRNPPPGNGLRVTLDIPKNAKTFRYSYIKDACAESSSEPKFDYITLNKYEDYSEVCNVVRTYKDSINLSTNQHVISEYKDLMSHGSSIRFNKNDGYFYVIFYADSTTTVEVSSNINTVMKLCRFTLADNSIPEYFHIARCGENLGNDIIVPSDTAPYDPEIIIKDGMIYVYFMLKRNGIYEYVYRTFNTSTLTFSNANYVKLDNRVLNAPNLVESYNAMTGKTGTQTYGGWGICMTGNIYLSQDGYYYTAIGTTFSGKIGLIIRSQDLVNWATYSVVPTLDADTMCWETSIAEKDNKIYCIYRNNGIYLDVLDKLTNTWGTRMKISHGDSRPYMIELNSRIILSYPTNDSNTIDGYGTVSRYKLMIAELDTSKINSVSDLDINKINTLRELKAECGIHYLCLCTAYGKLHGTYSSDIRYLNSSQCRSNISFIKNII